MGTNLTHAIENERGVGGGEVKEPLILKRGKEFHRKVQRDWKKTNRNALLSIEHTIKLNSQQKKLNHIQFN